MRHLKHITFHTARQDLREDCERFRNKAPANVLVTEHRTLGQLLEVLSHGAVEVDMVEIVGHGTPLSCGEILPINGGELQAVVARYKSSTAIVLSGCNTGVNAHPCSISQYLADQVNRPIHGVKGYVQGYAVIETLRSTRADAGGRASSVYEGSTNARFPRSLREFFPQGSPLKSSLGTARFDAQELRSQLAKLATGRDSVAVAEQIVNAITRGSMPTVRLPQAGTEAIFVHEGIQFELYSNLSAVDHHGDCWSLDLSCEARLQLRQAVDSMSQLGTIQTSPSS